MVVWAFGFFNRPPVERTDSGQSIGNTRLIAALASSHLQNGRPDSMRVSRRPFLHFPDRLHPVAKSAWK